MKNITFLLLIVSFSIFSCNSSSHADVDSSIQTFNEGNTAFPEVEATSVNSKNEYGIPEAPAEVYTAANLNPPHGEPGHDCSIAVGAPLNKPAAAGVTAPAPALTPGAMPPVQNSSNARLNPPHGQPGHVCEIPVGQPLP